MYSRVAIYTLYPTSKHFIEGEKQHSRMFLCTARREVHKLSVVNISGESLLYWSETGPVVTSWSYSALPTIIWWREGTPCMNTPHTTMEDQYNVYSSSGEYRVLLTWIGRDLGGGNNRECKEIGTIRTGLRHTIDQIKKGFSSCFLSYLLYLLTSIWASNLHMT